MEMRQKERLEQVSHLGEVIYDFAKGKNYLSEMQVKILQDIIDEVQGHLDEIANDISRIKARQGGEEKEWE